MNQRGSLTIEFALLVPALVLLFGVIVGGARVWVARSTVEQIAGGAARSASLERTAGEAKQAANQVATVQAQAGGLRCQPLSITVATADFALPIGTPARVGVTVHCDVPLADVLVPGWPGTVGVSASASSVLDRYRGRK
jgi:Flp pilus assembly protein TadG